MDIWRRVISWLLDLVWGSVCYWRAADDVDVLPESGLVEGRRDVRRRTVLAAPTAASGARTRGALISGIATLCALIAIVVGIVQILLLLSTFALIMVANGDDFGPPVSDDRAANDRSEASSGDGPDGGRAPGPDGAANTASSRRGGESSSSRSGRNRRASSGVSDAPAAGTSSSSVANPSIDANNAARSKGSNAAETSGQSAADVADPPAIWLNMSFSRKARRRRKKEVTVDGVENDYRDLLMSDVFASRQGMDRARIQPSSTPSSSDPAAPPEVASRASEGSARGDGRRPSRPAPEGQHKVVVDPIYEDVVKWQHRKLGEILNGPFQMTYLLNAIMRLGVVKEPVNIALYIHRWFMDHYLSWGLFYCMTFKISKFCASTYLKLLRNISVFVISNVSLLIDPEMKECVLDLVREVLVGWLKVDRWGGRELNEIIDDFPFLEETPLELIDDIIHFAHDSFCGILHPGKEAAWKRLVRSYSKHLEELKRQEAMEDEKEAAAARQANADNVSPPAQSAPEVQNDAQRPATSGEVQA